MSLEEMVPGGKGKGNVFRRVPPRRKRKWRLSSACSHRQKGRRRSATFLIDKEKKTHSGLGRKRGVGRALKRKTKPGSLRSKEKKGAIRGKRR